VSTLNPARQNPHRPIGRRRKKLIARLDLSDVSASVAMEGISAAAELPLDFA
jgi:hypothetical protein